MEFGILSFDIGNRKNITTVIEHAIKAEEAGLKRFWLGEHYGSEMWANPEPVIPVLLGMTERINIGAAGILMNLHSPYRVACSFKVMNAIFPGRVDLGIAKGSSTETFLELLHAHESGKPHPISKKIDNLFSYLHQPEKHLENGVLIHPNGYPAPDVWMLGLSYNGLKNTLKYNCHFSRSLFHGVSNLDPMVEELNIFRDQYGTQYGVKPKVNIAIAGVLGDTEAEAQKFYKRSVWGNNGFIAPNIVGSREHFKDYIKELNSTYDVDEIIFLDLSATMENKYETIELLSQVQQEAPLVEVHS